MNEFQGHRPGPISAFFVYKAAVFAAGFWAWLAVLVGRGGPVGGWHILTATGAICTTIAAVALGTRYALQADAAARHEQLMRTLVELSWEDFGRSASLPAKAGTDASVDGDAGVTRLSEQSRPRPRR